MVKKAVRRKPRRPAKRRISHEHNLQCAFFRWLTLQYPTVREVTFAIPNGARTTIKEGAWLKAEGLTKSIPDLYISVARQGYNGYYVEFKIHPNKPTDEQLEKHKRLREQGYKVDVIYSIDTAMESVKNYLKE